MEGATSLIFCERYPGNFIEFHPGLCELMANITNVLTAIRVNFFVFSAEADYGAGIYVYVCVCLCDCLYNGYNSRSI